MSSVTSPIATSTAARDNRNDSKNSNNTRWIGRTVIYGLLLIFAVLYLMPLFVMLTTSFKTMDEIQNGN
ncbi:carbohydrate ABC transporter permease, partial [Rhizobium leguminosarum bv. viciae]|nr:carbohydrate ABC transporter permease [Rhizobium leguminosarum]NKM48165.1 carbohydrate ABC transporter permease [Rhizobium leguminosarum bv. viciae]